MLRSLPRATPSSSFILGGLSIRSSLRRPIQPRIPLCAFEAQIQQQQHQKRHATTVEVFANPSLTRISDFAAPKQQKRHSTAPAHAVSNPMLAGIEKRWEVMPPQEQAELWMALRDRMKNDWHELTLQERKASYWIAFGPHGPRALPPPGQNWFIFWSVMGITGVCCVVFFIIRLFARGPPSTMTREWQEATNEYLRGQKVEPITGLSSEGYKGKGQIQSPPKKKD